MSEKDAHLNKNDMKQSVQKFFGKLKTAIINNELDLEMIFQHFDQNRNNFLDLDEFTKFVKVIYFKANQNDIRDAFSALDLNNDNKIQIEEFLKIVE